MTHPADRVRPPGKYGLAAVLAIVILATYWRYAEWMPTAFFGDDLNHYLWFLEGHCATRWDQVLTSACAEKFRPVFAAFMIAAFSAFGNALSHYLATNLLVHGANGVLMFLIARELSGGRLLVALAAALAFALSRFATFAATQVIAPVESLAMLLFLGGLYCLFAASENSGRRSWQWGWASLVLTLLAGYSHERYIAAAAGPFLGFLLLPSYRALDVRRRMILALASAATPVLNVAYKVAFLHAPFLVGTGYTKISFSFSKLALQFQQSVFSLFGFSTGPEYVIGVQISSLPAYPAWLLAFVLLGAWTVAVASRCVVLVKARSGPARESLARLAVLLVLGIALVASSIVTIFVELRWMWGPFATILLIGAWATRTDGAAPTFPRTVPFLLLCASSLMLDTQLMKHFDNIYVFNSAKFAGAVYRDVLPGERGSKTPLVFVTDEGYCTWGLLTGEFFRHYDGARRKVTCVGNLDQARSTALAEGARLYVRSTPTTIREVSVAAAAPPNPGSRVARDFIAEFAQGAINSLAAASTPTGRGVLLMRWETLGGPREAMTVLSGFTYRFGHIDIPPGAALQFRAGPALPSAQPARGVVRFVDETNGELLGGWSKDFSPLRKGERPEFAPFSIPLDRFRGKRISVQFGTESPGGDSSGHWIAFESPRMVVE